MSYQSEIEAAVLAVMRGNRYILGSEVTALESEIASFIGTTFAVGVANGTDAIELALRALDIGPGDEVITVSHTAVATVAAIEACGAVPVLVDVDPTYFTLNPDQLPEVLTSRTRAVIAVHLYGQAADLDAIGHFCAEHDLALIEDASQAHGARWKDRRVGSIGRIGCFSCYPTKNLGAIGDAGLITTSDPGLAEKLRMLREYGWRERYVSELPGLNTRLDELQAAILRIKLRHLDADNSKRRQIAGHYAKQLTGLSLGLPAARDNVEHVYHLFVARSMRRAELMTHLESRDIHAGVHYPVPVHLQPAYQGRILTAKSMVVSERLAAEVVSLPIYPELSPESADHVIAALKDFH
ncbi:DegT/DnrJ/EryC1/StrS family aminotransferase [Sulfuritalea sp.]|uniref:DegT/DnrJ/EryC1/StrS family aminotransferase n=1 Tax=Sulfuritalea sp. TaxID=2480090 RepID=UPI001AD0E28E|nr:DegT/DnrJ/EryC1/StrS family aminotransferase [Sulfuritalea sp.]MBN8473924.1 DegT/DnrJ/EryC1/StrS family aminotransferase [Sulfuritalea sp.]